MIAIAKCSQFIFSKEHFILWYYQGVVIATILTVCTLQIYFKTLYELFFSVFFATIGEYTLAELNSALCTKQIRCTLITVNASQIVRIYWHRECHFRCGSTFISRSIFSSSENFSKPLK